MTRPYLDFTLQNHIDEVVPVAIPVQIRVERRSGHLGVGQQPQETPFSPALEDRQTGQRVQLVPLEIGRAHV